MTITYNRIQAAQARLAQIAFSSGGDLSAWRRQQGIEMGALEQASGESADDTIEEIEAMIAEGGEFALSQLREFLMREFESAFQVGLVCREREDAAT